MAKRLKEIELDRRNPHEWAVFVDPAYDKDIASVQGVLNYKRLATQGIAVFTPDPRYDWDDLAREIIELCR